MEFIYYIYGTIRKDLNNEMQAKIKADYLIILIKYLKKNTIL